MNDITDNGLLGSHLFVGGPCSSKPGLNHRTVDQRQPKLGSFVGKRSENDIRNQGVGEILFL